MSGTTARSLYTILAVLTTTNLYTSRAEKSLPYIGGSELCWSPDGTEIVYACVREQHWEICKMNNDGSNQTRLTNTSAGVTNVGPSWYP